MYRVSADEYTREEIRAREDELRLQRTFESQIKKRDAAIAKHEATIAEQESTIAEQKSTIAILDAENERLRAEIAALKNQKS